MKMVINFNYLVQTPHPEIPTMLRRILSLIPNACVVAALPERLFNPTRRKQRTRREAQGGRYYDPGRRHRAQYQR